MVPGAYSGRTASYAHDLTLYTAGSNVGAWTTAANINWMQFELQSATDGVSAVLLYGGDTSLTSSSGFLTVYLSRGSNFSDTTNTVTCVQGVAIIAGSMGAVTCPSLTQAKYVTIYRNDPVTSDYLVLTEVQVLTGCKWL